MRQADPRKVLRPGGTVLVTGASGGVGSAVARLLAPHAAALILMDRTPPTELASSLAGEVPCIPLGADLGNPAALENALVEASECTGSITHLVHCAAVLRMSPIPDLTAAEFEEVLRINTIASFVLARRVAERSTGGGAVVFISSTSGFLSGTNSLAYSASKRALHSITQGLALEYGQKGLRVNAICPGSMETGIWTREVEADLRERLGANATDFLDEARRGSNIGVLPRPDDVAELVFFLLSNSGASISGQLYTVWGHPIGGA